MARNDPRLTTTDCEKAVAALAVASERLLRLNKLLTYDEHIGEVGQSLRHLVVAMNHVRNNLSTVRTVD